MDELEQFMKQTVDELDTLRSEMLSRGRGVFKAALKQLFDAHPELTHIMWNQYTPYFNDGDICTFRAGEVLFSKFVGEFEDGPIEYYHSYDSNHEGTYYDRYEPDFPKAFTVFANFIDHDEELLQPMFGDHAFIMIRRTADGRIEQIVDEYEHD